MINTQMRDELHRMCFRGTGNLLWDYQLQLLSDRINYYDTYLHEHGGLTLEKRTHLLLLALIGADLDNEITSANVVDITPYIKAGSF